METIVAGQIDALFPGSRYPNWTAGYLPIGAGMPDLVVVSSNPEVVKLTAFEKPNAHILAYLRVVQRARLTTIAEKLNCSLPRVAACLEGLVKASVVEQEKAFFRLTHPWRNILDEIVTIEVKVNNWRKAVEQASRNGIFAHRSYIALPQKVAARVKDEPILRKQGIGILAVEDSGSVLMFRKAPRRQPRVWAYYYELASIAARHLGIQEHAISRAN
jgi:hypothetical protein